MNPQPEKCPECGSDRPEQRNTRHGIAGLASICDNPWHDQPEEEKMTRDRGSATADASAAPGEVVVTLTLGEARAWVLTPLAQAQAQTRGVEIGSRMAVRQRIAAALPAEELEWMGRAENGDYSDLPIPTPAEQREADNPKAVPDA